VLQVAPSTYYEVKARSLRPPCARAQREAVLRPALRALWEANYQVYGARKLWKAARRAGHDVGRDQVARLMRADGLEGARRSKRVRTTRAEPTAARHPDLVGRDFTATAPNQLVTTRRAYARPVTADRLGHGSGGGWGRGMDRYGAGSVPSWCSRITDRIMPERGRC